MRIKLIGTLLLCTLIVSQLTACGSPSQESTADTKSIAETELSSTETSSTEEVSESLSVAEDTAEGANELIVKDEDTVIDVALTAGSSDILTIAGDNDIENGTQNAVEVKMQVLSFAGELDPASHYMVADAGDVYGKGGEPGFYGDELEEGLILDYGELHPHAELSFNMPPGLTEISLKVVVHPLKGLHITVEHYDTFSQVPQTFNDEQNTQMGH